MRPRFPIIYRDAATGDPRGPAMRETPSGGALTSAGARMRFPSASWKSRRARVSRLAVSAPFFGVFGGEIRESAGVAKSGKWLSHKDLRRMVVNIRRTSLMGCMVGQIGLV